MEEWKPVKGYEFRYAVSSEGRVWDLLKNAALSQVMNGGNLCVNLNASDGSRKNRRLCKVHRLVAEAFIPNPENSHIVAHKGNKEDNSVSNLYWRPKQEKELKGFKPQSYEYRGQALLVSDIAKMAGVDATTARKRLKEGWSVDEVVRNYKYKYYGILTETHWFPSADAKRKYGQNLTLKERAAKKEEARKKKEEWKNYKKYGVGVFVNEPIKGIENRKANKIYRTWNGILSRCYNPKHSHYHIYGGNGVFVCEEWYEFQKFAAWFIDQYYEDDWQIDKDLLNDGVKRYSPETCCLLPPALNSIIANPKTRKIKIIEHVSKYGHKLPVHVLSAFSKIGV